MSTSMTDIRSLARFKYGFNQKKALLLPHILGMSIEVTLDLCCILKAEYKTNMYHKTKVPSSKAPIT